MKRNTPPQDPDPGKRQKLASSVTSFDRFWLLFHIKISFWHFGTFFYYFIINRLRMGSPTHRLYGHLLKNSTFRHLNLL
jgi:hypothetical protein